MAREAIAKRRLEPLSFVLRALLSSGKKKKKKGFATLRVRCQFNLRTISRTIAIFKLKHGFVLNERVFMAEMRIIRHSGDFSHQSIRP